MLLNKWMHKLPRNLRVGITIVSMLLVLLSFTLLLAGIINDGNNQFALSFYFKKEVVQKNENFVKFLELIANKNIDTNIKNLFIENTKPTISYTEYVQNSNALGWFVATMILIFCLALIFSNSAALTNLKVLKNTINDCHREHYLTQWGYNTLNKIVEVEQKNDNKNKLEKVKLYEKVIETDFNNK